MEELLRELAAYEYRSVKMDDAMAGRLEARMDARFRLLADRSYSRRSPAVCAAAFLLALGCLALLQLPEEGSTAPALAVLPSAEPEMIAAADWDKHFPPAPAREAVTRHGVEYHIETEENLPFTINDCYL